MVRKAITKQVKETVLKEYSHRCSICGCDHPQIHHIDEDHENNDLMNLLPLCPNCHLSDQHNPTRKIDISKLKLFRKFKDPSILKPQFHPIFTRQIFLDDIDINNESTSIYQEKSTELIEFIEHLEMGGFYGKRIGKLITKSSPVHIVALGRGRDEKLEHQLREENRRYREMLYNNNEEVKSLLVELLRYQSWESA